MSRNLTDSNRKIHARKFGTKIQVLKTRCQHKLVAIIIVFFCLYVLCHLIMIPAFSFSPDFGVIIIFLIASVLSFQTVSFQIQFLDSFNTSVKILLRSFFFLILVDNICIRNVYDFFLVDFGVWWLCQHQEKLCHVLRIIFLSEYLK